MSDYKIIIEGEEARKKLSKGADTLAKAVVSTLGPSSRNVALNRPYPAPDVLHDGVSVAREIKLKDPFEDMGAALIKEAATKTNDLVGDGTTTATLLANTLFQEGLKMIKGGIIDGVIAFEGSIDSMKLQKQLLIYSEKIVSLLEKKSKKIKDRNEYLQIATVSSGSEEIGRLIADAIEKLGPEAVISVEESGGFDSSLDIQEGMEFDNGFLSGYFVTDPDRMEAVYGEGYVLLTDHTIVDAMQLVPVVQLAMKDGNKPLLIIANDVVGAALTALIQTKLKLQAGLVAVVAPEYGERRKQVLDDLAVLLGANVISKDLDKKLEDVTLGDLGRVKSFKVTQTHTTVIPMYPDGDELAERVSAIKKQIDAESNDFKKERLQARLAKLSQKVAIINIGGGSASEMHDKRERAIDASHATKAALADGVIPGGGVALRDIAKEVIDNPSDPIQDLVLKALIAPFETIIENAGLKPLEDMHEGEGINVINGEVVNMIEAGILDPVKVTKLAIIHAFSIAGIMLTTDYLISDDLEANRNIQTVRAIQ